MAVSKAAISSGAASSTGPAAGSGAASGIAQTAGFQRWKRIGGYVFSVLVPWLAADLSFHTEALRGIRLALSLAACASSAAAFGLGPALVAIATSALAFNYFAGLVQKPAPTVEDILIRTFAILAVGFFLVLMTRQRTSAERKLRLALNNLQEQTDALVQAQQASHSAVWTFESHNWDTRWYAGGAEIFNPNLATRSSLPQLAVDEDRPAVEAAIQHAIQTGEPLFVEFRVAWPNGDMHWVEARGVPTTASRAVWRGTAMDVTERKQAEAALIRTEKLAVAGRLAASIAHEINNPLEAVTNLCYLAKHTATDAETKSYIELAEIELSRVAHITSQTLRFHRQQTAPTETDVGELVRSIVSLYQHRLAQAGIAVETEATPARPLLCYGGEIRQVLANLIANAMDAMPMGGPLRLRVRKSVDWRTGLEAVRVTVADMGHGMSPETCKRIFEAFYTTKGDAGTGLGLWISAGIIEKHKGSLRVRSVQKASGGGTTFSLVLPYPVDTGDIGKVVREMRGPAARD